jgi:hypothetical protein
MGDSKDLVVVIEEWFTIHAFDENFKGPFIAETSSQSEAILTKQYLEKNPHPRFGSRYIYEVQISPRLKKGETHLTFELSVGLDAMY